MSRRIPESLQSFKQQRGVILLVLLSVLVLALTSVIIAKVSLNKLRTQNMQSDSEVLQRAQEALLAFSVMQPVRGTLPCPDTDATPDGLENRSGTNCTQSRGRLPWRTLALDRLTDSSGTDLWYAVASAYTDSSGTIARNSSIANNYSLDGQSVSAVVIAPGRALNGQTRNNFNVSNYLEGENGNASVNSYAQVIDDDNNDLLIGLPVNEFWNLNEKIILAELATLLRAYQVACSNEYPFAASFTAGADNSLNNLQSGSFPLETALLDNWNSGCALGIAPSAELRTHWRDQIYYAFCRSGEGNCLQLTGDSSQQVRAVLIAPGVALAGQNRSTVALDEFFEDDNVAGASPYKILRFNPVNTSFNDHVYIVSP